MVVVFGLLLFSLAGCIASNPGGEPDLSSPDERTLLERDWDALPHGESAEETEGNTTDRGSTRGSGSSSDGNEVFLFSSKTRPESALTGFTWQIPEAAIKPWGSTGSFQVLSFEIFPVVPVGSDTELDEWTFLLYHIQDGQAHLILEALAPTVNMTNQLAVLPTQSTQSPPMEAVHVQTIGSDIEAGDEIAIVVGARSAQEDEFGFLVRSGTGESLPEEPDDFVGDDPVLSLPPTGTGQGMQIAMYLNIHALAVIGLEAWTEAVDVSDRLFVDTRPIATARDVTIASSFDGDGWTIGSGFYMGYNAQGTWELESSFQGHELDARSLIMQHWARGTVLLAEAIAFGLPVYFAVADGTGGTSAEFELLVTNANYFESLVFIQVDLGATLESLVGVPSQTLVGALTGLLGDVPPAVAVGHSGDDLVLEYENGRTTWIPGLLAAEA